MRDVQVIGGPPRVALDELIRRIRAYLAKTEVVQAVLFGSYARGEADVASDVDLLLVESTAESFPERGLRHLPLFRLGVGLDLLVYTPEEMERLRQDDNPFIERIL